MNGWMVEFYTRVKRQTCPFFKKIMRGHSYRNQSIQGIMLSNTPIKIKLRKRRYLCTHCHHTLYEKLQMIERYQRCTSIVQTMTLAFSVIGSFKLAALLTGFITNRLLRIFDRHKVQSEHFFTCVSYR